MTPRSHQTGLAAIAVFKLVKGVLLLLVGLGLLKWQLSLDCINALCYSPVNKERHDATCR